MSNKYLNFVIIFILSINWSFGKPGRKTTIALEKFNAGSKSWLHRSRRSDNNENLKDLIVQIADKIVLPSGICYTVEGPNPNTPCKFPFIWDGITYNGCPIDQDDNKKRRWCSTKVDSNGNHLIEKNEYGYCSNNCPIHNEEDEIEDDYDQYYDEGFCKTVSDSGSQLNKKCKLPFTFQGTKYSTCISGSKREKLWCPTKLDANGSYIRGKWGYCDTSLCPIESSPSLISTSTESLPKIGMSICTGLYQCRPSSQPSSSSSPKTRNTVLVVTGNPVSKNLPSEVFDLANEESNCAPLENVQTRAIAVGGLINNTPVVCGGIDNNRNFFDDCVLIGKSKKIPMVSTRYTHTAVNLDSGRLWILGGSNKSVSYLETTEIVSIEKSVKGIDLPSTWRFGCAVNVNNKIYLIGGKRNYDITNKIWIVDPSNGFKIEEGPPMNNRRQEHMCAVMPDKQTIIVAGTSEKQFGKTTEYYDIKSKTWKMGPELPFLLQQSQMVKLSDGVMLIGGHEKIGHRYKKEFLKLKSVTSKWEIQDKLQLSVGRNSHVVIPIPEQMTNCT